MLGEKIADYSNRLTINLQALSPSTIK